MEEGKIPSDLFTVADADGEEPPSHLGMRLSMGRFNTNISSTLDVPDLSDEEELGLANVAIVFNVSGLKRTHWSTAPFYLGSIHISS